ncbi:MAG TPA: response regulator transcription factor [Anaerolineae bacterium]|jgi:NarL family two-component system response regulator LiaR
MSNSHKISVMLVDDHAMVRRGLSTFLKVFDDLELVCEVSSGEAAIQKCDEMSPLPDVVLMDMVMPGMDGSSATRVIRQRHPTVQVIALTSFKEETLVQSALQAGAIGYLLKDISADELAKAIRAAQAGRATLSSDATQALVHAASQPPVPGSDLTARERDVLALMLDGSNNNEIAAKLVVSPSTIKSHVSNILSKLGVSSRTEAVALAVRHRIVN